MSSGDFGKDDDILKELREISNRHSRHYSRDVEVDKRRHLASASASASGEKENTENGQTTREGGNCNNFLCRTKENGDLNQYWYSKNTIEVLCDATREGLSMCKGKRVAFLSTPSLFFSLSAEEREDCTLFEYDPSWESCPGYHFYDFNDPSNIKDSYLGVFDMIVIDPPFISQHVWESYATTAKLLMNSDGASLIIATTVDENKDLMRALLDCRPTSFRPSIPNLVYQYSVFTNFESSVLNNKNSELMEETT